jgi:hypothetical protein
MSNYNFHGGVDQRWIYKASTTDNHPTTQEDPKWRIVGVNTTRFLPTAWFDRRDAELYRGLLPIPNDFKVVECIKMPSTTAAVTPLPLPISGRKCHSCDNKTVGYYSWCGYPIRPDVMCDCIQTCHDCTSVKLNSMFPQLNFMKGPSATVCNTHVFPFQDTGAPEFKTTTFSIPFGWGQ